MEDGSKDGEMVAGERGRREKGDNAIISIADIAISAVYQHINLMECLIEHQIIKIACQFNS